METVCDRCCSALDDEDVQQCEVCGADGLCDDCLVTHECALDTGEGKS